MGLLCSESSGLGGSSQRTPADRGGGDACLSPERPGDRHFWHLEGMGSPAARHPWGPRRGNTGAVGGQAPTRCGERGGWRAGEGDAGPMRPRRDPGRAEGQTGVCTWTWGQRHRVPSEDTRALRRFEMLTGEHQAERPLPLLGTPSHPLFSSHHRPAFGSPFTPETREGIARKMREETTHRPAGH